MRVFLLYKNHDLDLQQKLPWNEKALTQDLELNKLFYAMAGMDEFFFDIAKKVVFSGLNNDLDTILYRQNILKDCLKNSAIIKALNALAIDAIECRKKTWWGYTSHPSSILSSSITILELLLAELKKLRSFADKHNGKFESEGFTQFFTMLQKELGDEYFAEVQNHLDNLKFPDGILLSAELGKGNKSNRYLLHKFWVKKRCWLLRLFVKKPDVYTFNILSRDESGYRALSALNDEGINDAANALAQSTDHILGFFHMLRAELAFYLGCLNLHEQLIQTGKPVCFPVPVASDERRHSFKGLYDASLALSMKQKIVGNDVDADNKNLVMITGANQGGKSTFLRSIDSAQLMMQCGMFVPAESLCVNICSSLFTHFKREEDATMKSGKLDEELSRMSAIADYITSDSMLLFNESFAATNEREGSEIAGQIVNALVEKRIKVFFVTHLYEFAHVFYLKKIGTAIFLRAERENDGSRTFKLTEGEPLQTSFGEDLYNRIFKT